MPDPEARQRIYELESAVSDLRAQILKNSYLLQTVGLAPAESVFGTPPSDPFPSSYLPVLHLGKGDARVILASGDYPYLLMGSAVNFRSEEGMWMGRDVDGLYKAVLDNVKLRGQIEASAMKVNVQQAMGGTFIVSEVADVFADKVEAADTTIVVANNVLEENHILRVQPSGTRLEYMRVTSGPTTVQVDSETMGYQYNVTRDLDGSGANVFYAGESFITIGKVTQTNRCAMVGEGDISDGFVAHPGTSMMAVGGLAASSYGGWVHLEGGDSGPFMSIVRRHGPGHGDFTHFARIGLLRNFLDYGGLFEYGFGVGEPGDFITWDKVKGLRLFAGGKRVGITGDYVKPPNMSEVERDAIDSEEGMTIYNEDRLRLETYVNGVWDIASNKKHQELQDGSNISWDSRLGPVAHVTLNGSRTLNNPSNLINGEVYALYVTQGSGGSYEITYGTNYYFEGGTPPTLSTTEGQRDLLVFLTVAGVLVLIGFLANVSAASSAFSPDDLDNLVFWMKSDVGVTTSGSDVTDWANQGSGQDFEAPSGKEPSLLQNQINGYPAIYFDGVDETLLTVGNMTELDAKTNVSMFVVFKWPSGQTAGMIVYIVEDAVGSNNDAYGIVAAWQNVDRDVACKAQDNVLDGYNSYETAINKDRWTHIHYKYDGTQAVSEARTSFYSKGVEKTPTPQPADDYLAAALPSFTEKMSIGAMYYNAQYAGFSEIYIAEIIIYSDELSEAEAQQVQSYLSSKYDL